MSLIPELHTYFPNSLPSERLAGLLASGTTSRDPLARASQLLEVGIRALEAATAIANEIAAREAADNALDARIDTLEIFTMQTNGVENSQIQRNVGAAVISSINGNGTTVTVTTAANHGFTTGDRIRITGTTNYNTDLNVGITVTAANQFTYADPSADRPTNTAGYARHIGVYVEENDAARFVVGQRVRLPNDLNDLHKTTIASLDTVNDIVYLTDPVPADWNLSGGAMATAMGHWLSVPDAETDIAAGVYRHLPARLDALDRIINAEEEFGVVAGTTADQGPAIQAALNAAAAHPTRKTVLLSDPVNTYRIATTVSIPSGVWLIGPDGGYAHIDVATGTGNYGVSDISLITIQNVNDVGLLRLHLSGANKGYPGSDIPYGSGVYMYNVSRARIEDCYIQNVSSAIHAENVRHSTIAYNYITGKIVQDCIQLFAWGVSPGCHHNVVIGNRMYPGTGNGAMGVRVSGGNNGRATHNTIVGNVCKNVALEAYLIDKADYNAFSGNTADACGYGLVCYAGEHNVCDGFTISDTASVGIYFHATTATWHVRYNIVTNCVLKNIASTTNSALLVYTDLADVEYNKFANILVNGVSDTGLFLHASNNTFADLSLLAITNNAVTVDLGSEYNQIVGVVADDVGGQDFYILGSYNELASLIMRNTAGNGVQIGGDHNTISGMLAEGVQGTPISVGSAESNTIRDFKIDFGVHPGTHNGITLSGTGTNNNTFERGIILNPTASGIYNLGTGNTYRSIKIVEPDERGILSIGPETLLTDIVVRVAGENGVSIDTTGTDTILDNVIVLGAGANGIFVSATRCKVRNCIAEDATDQGILISATSCQVVGCHVAGSGQHGIRAGSSSSDLLVNGNHVRMAGLRGIYTEGNVVLVTNNYVGHTGSANPGISVSGTNSRYNGNIVSGHTDDDLHRSFELVIKRFTNATYNGSAGAALGSYTITAASYGYPATAKAVLLHVQVYWNTIASDNAIVFSRAAGTDPTGTHYSHIANYWHSQTIIVPCASDGSFRISVQGTHAPAFLQMDVVGFFI